jgi:hypothetical protein
MAGLEASMISRADCGVLDLGLWLAPQATATTTIKSEIGRRIFRV